MKLSLAIRNSTYEGNIEFSLLQNGILPDCTLKPLCDEIDKIRENYTKQTTTIIDSFSFEKWGYCTKNLV